MGYRVLNVFLIPDTNPVGKDDQGGNSTPTCHSRKGVHEINCLILDYVASQDLRLVPDSHHLHCLWETCILNLKHKVFC